MYQTFIYVAIFLIYSFIGWIVEVSAFLIQDHKFVNRGFFIGPVVPIYGTGGILITLLLTKYQSDPVTLFCMAVVVCSILEYFTSYVMEKLFKTRWWDYSNKKFNINGRICLTNLLFFGLMGLVMVYLVNQKGKFNVPHGRYKNPLICDKENLLAVSKLLKNTNIINVSFLKSEKKSLMIVF